MSAFKLFGNPSGSGAGTLTSAALTGDRIFTFPDRSGEVPLVGPAFHAHSNVAGTTVNHATFTKITCKTEVYDTDGCYDAVTNFRFLPNVPGYYFIAGAWVASASAATLVATLYKNGVEAVRGTMGGASTSALFGSQVAGLIYLDGIDDYVELYGYHEAGAARTVNYGAAWVTYFQGVFIRP